MELAEKRAFFSSRELLNAIPIACDDSNGIPARELGGTHQDEATDAVIGQCAAFTLVPPYAFVTSDCQPPLFAHLRKPFLVGGSRAEMLIVLLDR